MSKAGRNLAESFALSFPRTRESRPGRRRALARWIPACAGMTLGAALTAGSASAADVRIADIKAFLFLERSGKWSANIVGGPTFADLAKGGGAIGEPATGVFVDLTFSGDKNSAPKFATATVNIAQTGKAGQQIVTHKAFTNFIFGADGVQHKAFFLESATCMPMTIDVKTPKAQKSIKLDFECKEQAAYSPSMPSTSAIE